MGDTSFESAQACDLCQDRAASRLWQKNGFDILRCRTCGLVRTNLPAGLDLASIYDQGYYQGARPDGYADYAGAEPVIRREFRQVIRNLQRLCPSTTSSTRLLDIGAAYGFLLDEARPHFESTGVEVSAVAAKFAHQRGHQVHLGSYDATLAATIGPVEVVTLLDTIEHLSSPAQALATIYRQLTPGGILYLTTGDFDSWLSRLMKKNWRLMTPPQHTFFFSRQTLLTLLTQTGFRVLHADRPWKIVPLGLAAYQLGARTGLRIRPLERVPYGLPLNFFDTIRVIARK